MPSQRDRTAATSSGQQRRRTGLSGSLLGCDEQQKYVRKIFLDIAVHCNLLLAMIACARCDGLERKQEAMAGRGPPLRDLRTPLGKRDAGRGASVG